MPGLPFVFDTSRPTRWIFCTFLCSLSYYGNGGFAQGLILWTCCWPPSNPGSIFAIYFAIFSLSIFSCLNFQIGVLHRGISPDVLMLDQTGHIQVYTFSDFFPYMNIFFMVSVFRKREQSVNLTYISCIPLIAVGRLQIWEKNFGWENIYYLRDGRLFSTWDSSRQWSWLCCWLVKMQLCLQFALDIVIFKITPNA